MIYGQGVFGTVHDRKRLAVYLGSFIGPLSGNAVLALVPTLKTAFHASAPEVLVSISFFMIPFAFFTLFSGTISDVYDRKKTVLIGFVVYAVGSLMCALSWNLGFFLLSRTVQGLGYGFVSPVMVAILGDIVPFEERGKSMGYLGAATTAGIALGPFIAGFIAILDWRLVFVFIAALILATGAFFNFEFRGVTFPRGPKGARSVLRNLKSGIMDRSVLVLSLAGLLTFMCYVSTLSFMSDHLSLPPLFLSESEIGTVMATTGIAGIFAAPLGGRLADRLGRFTTATIGYAIAIGAFVLLGLSSTTGGYVGSLAVL
ncbi:MAG: MFS transporter, partial [Euryarchaeota archaeon]|nr:MFS transporter [Euryarchaeota archaeon]